MKKISKILLIIFISILCILVDKNICYGEDYPNLPTLHGLIYDLGPGIEGENGILAKSGENDSKVTLNGDTGVGYSDRFYKVERDASVASTSKSYTYCVSRGIGNGELGDYGEYNMQAFIIISKEGIFYKTAYEDNASDFNSNSRSLRKISWEQAKEDEIEESAKKIYYILNAGDGYGTNDNAVTALAENRLNVVNKIGEDKDGNAITESYTSTARQHAIWMTVNPLLDYRKVIQNSVLMYNTIGISDDNNLLIDAENNWNKNIDEKKPVYMWILKSKEENGFYQHILVGGTRDEDYPPSENPPENPPDTPTTTSFSIKKLDDSGSQINSGVQFGLRKKGEIYASNTFKYFANVENGICVFKDIEPGTYYIYETQNTNAGYNLKFQAEYYSDYTMENGYLRIGERTWNAGDNETLEFKNIKTGSIKIKKVDQNGNPVSGISFDLIEGKYTGTGDNYSIYVGLDNKIKSGTTDSNGELVFDNLAIGTYTIRETWSTQESFRRNIGYTMTITIPSSDPNKYYKNPISISNTNYGGLEITKTDKYRNKPLSGVGFKLYQHKNQWECVYTLADTNSSGKTSSSSSLGGNSSISLKNEYGIDVNTEYTIKPGTYYLYEYKNPNEGYNIEFQGQRYEQDRGAYIGQIKIEAGKITNVNDISYTYTNPNTGKDESTKYTQNEQFGSIYLYKYIETLQNNEIIRNPLEGAKFKLYQGDKIIKLRNIDGSGDTEEFTSKLTDDKKYAKVSIERIPAGTYELYETGFPSDVNPIIQPGYDPSKNAVKVATVTISKDGKATVEMVEDNGLIKGRDNKNYYYRSYSITEKSTGTEVKVNIFDTNRKYINVTGFVWEDVPNNKENTYDSKYNEGAGKLDGNAYSGTLDVSNSTEKKITSSIDIGMYTINGSNPVGSISKSNENYTITKVDASKLEDYYIIFDYSEYNEKNGSKDNQYITCAPGLTGDDLDLSITSKALVNKADIKVSDSDLIEEANTGSYLGTILKDSSKRGALFKYINGVPTIQYINLGIKRLPNTSYKLSNNLAKVIIQVNKHSFTYTYGDSGVGEAEKLEDLRKSNGQAYPKVNWQSKTDYLAYTRSIYPSDITTLNSEDENKIKVYVVYRIDVTDTTNYNISQLYCEDNLQLDKINSNSPVKMEYDISRYVITDENWGGYSDNKVGYAYLTENGINNPINNSAYVYVQFRVKDNAIMEILKGNTYEDFPTKAITKAHHNYHRKDYYWEWSNNIANSSYKENNKHTTTSQEKSEEAPYLKFTLSEDRKISGTVFKDNCTEVAAENNEVLGDGKYDSSEKKVSSVQVELLNKDDELVNLYPKNKVLDAYEKDTKGNFETTTKTNDDGTTNSIWKIKENFEFEKAITKTKDNGEYSFEGVVPGEYYIRFTYGNGEQIICDTEGNAIRDEDGNLKVYSNGYKSTIVSEDIADTVKNIYTRANDDLTDEDKLWYISLEDDYNTAVDNGINNTDSNNNGIDDCFEYELQIDYRTQNKNQDFVAGTKSSDTPLISVPIEFTTSKEGGSATQYPSFDHMSFGIIEKPKITINLKKEITNIKLTYYNGQVLINGNPTQNIPYTANLDVNWSRTGSRTGSSDTKIEIDNQYMYGSTLEITYSITVENDSDLTYITEDYYKYGTDKSEEAKIYVNTLLEYLDPLLKLKRLSDIKTGSGDNEYTYNVNNEIEIKDTTLGYREARNTLAKNESKGVTEVEDALKSKYNKVYELGSEDLSNTINNNTALRTKKISNDESSTTVKVVAQRILSKENDDLSYTSYAQVSKVTIAKNAYSDPTAAPLVKVDGEDYWKSGKIQPYNDIPEDSSKIAVTPSTGMDRNMKYYTATAIVLIALGVVIVCIKKIIK